MGRRKKRNNPPNRPRTTPNEPFFDPQWLDAKPDRPWAAPSRPNKGLLAGAALLQAAWIGFLVVMAVWG